MITAVYSSVLTVVCSNGSYYYQNPDGSKYYNDGQGFAKFDRAEKK